MDYDIAARFNLDKENPHMRQLPLPMRKMVYDEVKELLPESDEYFEENPEHEAIAIHSETWPVTYMFCATDDRVIVIVHIYNETLTERESVLTFNFNRHEMDKLLEA